MRCSSADSPGKVRLMYAFEGVVGYWCDPLTLQPEQKGGKGSWRRHGGGLGRIRPPPILKSRRTLSMKNGTKLVGYTYRLKNYVKIPPISLRFFRAGAATGVRYVRNSGVPRHLSIMTKGCGLITSALLLRSQRIAWR